MKYPTTPGYKVTGTSSAAAAQVEPKSQNLRAKVLLTLKQYGPMTADEIADFIRVDFASIRPRCSELRRFGDIEPTGFRRPSRTGTMQNVWRLKQYIH